MYNVQLFLQIRDIVYNEEDAVAGRAKVRVD